MGHIKEPEGVDLLIESSLLTGQERKRISEIIAHFKATGKKWLFKKPGLYSPHKRNILL